MANYVEELKALRKKVPVPVAEGLTYLVKTNGDIEEAAKLYVAENVQLLCREANCEAKEALAVLVYFKYDTIKSRSYIQERQYDASYVPNSEITIDRLEALKEWLYWFAQEDFIGAMSFEQIGDVLALLKAMPSLTLIAQEFLKAHERKNFLMHDVDGLLDGHEYTNRRNALRKDVVFNEAEAFISMRISQIEKELERHMRNARRWAHRGILDALETEYFLVSHSFNKYQKVHIIAECHIGIIQRYEKMDIEVFRQYFLQLMAYLPMFQVVEMGIRSHPEKWHLDANPQISYGDWLDVLGKGDYDKEDFDLDLGYAEFDCHVKTNDGELFPCPKGITCYPAFDSSYQELQFCLNFHMDFFTLEPGRLDNVELSRQEVAYNRALLSNALRRLDESGIFKVKHFGSQFHPGITYKFGFLDGEA